MFAQTIQLIMPMSKRCSQFAEPLTAAMDEFDIVSPVHRAAFLAQIAHESAELSRTEENLRYSPARIMEVFPRHVSSWADAERLSKSPDKLASRVYANACAYTTDLSTFASWTQIQATFPMAGQATYGAAIAPVICGSSLLFIPADGLVSGSGSGHAATVSASYSSTWASGADYVGHSLPVTLNSDGTYSSTRFAGYVRVA